MKNVAASGSIEEDEEALDSVEKELKGFGDGFRQCGGFKTVWRMRQDVDGVETAWRKLKIVWRRLHVVWRMRKCMFKTEAKG